ncbi:anti-repressor SinI family protein [Ectobacillus sp. sgz5001026]
MAEKEIQTLDIEWVELILEALSNGITEREIRDFLDRQKM